MDCHQAKSDDDSDGDGADVTFDAINLGSDIPEDERDDGDTSADDDERVVLEVHELLTLKSENLLLCHFFVLVVTTLKVYERLDESVTSFWKFPQKTYLRGVFRLCWIFRPDQ